MPSFIHYLIFGKRYKILRAPDYKYEVQNSELISKNVVPAFSGKEQADLGKIIINRELLNALEASLQQIPVHCRAVFVLREIEGFSVTETADLLDITPVNRPGSSMDRIGVF